MPAITPTLAQTLVELPFAEQIEAIESQLSSAESPGGLLSALAEFPDHEPLAHGLRVLLLRGDGLARGETQEVLCEVLSSLPDTGVRRVLRGLERMILSEAQLEALAALVLRVVEGWPIDRIAVICLADRWLKNAAPRLHRRWRAGILESLRQQLREGGAEAIEDKHLLHLPGSALQEFAALAHQRGGAEAWHERLGRFADGVLQRMRSSPRSLSQANAEELLSRRVYTDPGHFLIELFQNAEDAKARYFRVDIGAKEVSVRHDGAPFDAKDVVGVLSIGQTTKAREQIGFFGVGFKSVYELCERPQIHSELFCFEIADVSIPRRLSADPTRAPGETLLKLPYRRSPVAEEVEAWSEGSAEHRALLYQRALAVPPETLLTLGHLQAFAVSMDDQRRTVLRRAAEEPHVVELFLEEEQAVRRYRVASDHFAYDGPQRELNRAMETGILIALAMDEQGAIQAIPAHRPTLFSHLPTDERSGLRFLLHAHFELPVDRERLDLSSPWNRWALGRAGVLLGSCVAALCEEAASRGPAAKSLASISEILPLPSELRHEAYHQLLEAARRELQGLACFPAAGGGWLRPAQARWLEEPSLLPVLSGVALDPQGAALLPWLEHRARQVAECYGASKLEAAEIVALLESHLADHPSGEAWPTPWLAAGYEVLLSALGQMLSLPGTSQPAALQRWAQKQPQDADLLERLCGLPLWPDQEALPRRLHELSHGEPRLRALYGPHRCFVHPALVEAPTPGQRALLAALPIPKATPQVLLQDLEDPDLAPKLLEHAGAIALHSYLCRLDAGLTEHLGLLPLFPTIDGLSAVDPEDIAVEHRALFDDAEIGDKAWITPTDGLLGWLRTLDAQGACPPLLLPPFCRVYGDYLRRLGGEVLDLEACLGLLHEGRLQLSATTLAGLHEYVEARASEWTPRLCARLSEAPLFVDVEGRRRPLRGEGRAYLPAPGDPYVLALAPEAPWLAEAQRSLSYLQRLPVAAVGLQEVVRLLCEEHSGPLLRVEQTASLRRAYSYLLAQREELLPRERQALVAAPIWLDHEGQRRRLYQLQTVADDADVTALFQAFEARALIEAAAPGGEDQAPTALELVEGLGLLGELTRPGLSLLLERLPHWKADWSAQRELWLALRRALKRAWSGLPPRGFGPILELPIFAAVDGQLRPMGRWQEPLEGGRVYRASAPLKKALAHGPVALLSAEDEGFWSDVFEALGVGQPGVEVLLGLLEQGAFGDAQPSEVAAAAREALVALGPELPRDEASRSRLSALAIWPSQGGTLLPACELLVPHQLRALLGEALERFALDGQVALLHQEAWDDASQLQQHLDFGAPLEQLRAQLRQKLLPGAPLVEQPPPFDALDALVQATALLCQYEGVGLALSLPLSLDVESRLQTGPLWMAEGDALLLARKLSLREGLASPVWVQQVLEIDAELVRPLSSDRLLRELVSTARAYDDARAKSPQRDAEDAQALDALCHHESFYRWLEDALEGLAEDPQLLGLLGNAPLLKTAAGGFRSPRSLLWVVSGDLAAALQLDGWRCDPQIPASLQAALHRLFALEDEALERLVGVLTEAHLEAQSQEDGERSQAILHAMAEALPLGDAESREEAPLATEQISRLVRRHKLSRLRVETAEGGFARIGKLIFPKASHKLLLSAFLKAPFPQIHERYDTPSLRRFFAALGAPSHLPAGQLKALLEDESPELEAQLSLARYLAALLEEAPGLRQQLPLESAAWVPDGLGRPRTPGQLYWPDSWDEGCDASISALIGEAPQLYPHPAFFRTTPRKIAATLPFRQAEDAQLRDVLAFLGRCSEASFAQLSWLERHLRQKRGGAEAVVEAFAAAPLLRDDEGILRHPEELLCTPGEAWIGQLRATWSLGLRFSKLASTLGVPHRVGPAEIFAYGRGLAQRLEARGGEQLLREAPDLHERLPRCLALLGERKAPASGAMPLLLEAFDGRRDVGLASSPGLVLPTPAQQMEAARAQDLPLWFPVLLDGAQEPSLRWLRSCGVKGLDGLFEFEAPPPPETPAQPRPRRDAASPNSPRPAEPPTEAPEPGLWSRLKRWWSQEPKPSPPAASAPGKPQKPEERAVSTPSMPGVTGRGRGPARRPQAEEHGQWFRSRPAIHSQLDSDGQGWLEDRKDAPYFGYGFAPSPLPYPHLYAPQLLAERFQSQSQSWSTAGMPHRWRQGGEELGFRVALEGSLPGGENLFPLPLYSRLDVVQGAALIAAQDGQRFLMAQEVAEVRCELVLLQAPQFEGYDGYDEAIPKALLQPLVPDGELPPEVLDALDEQLDRGELPLHRALWVRDFIREHYQYDPSYIEDPAVARWLSRVSRGRANAHLAALHAGRDGQHLGRGVCYEFGALACEMMRRLGIPAAVASGWTWESGQLSDPDHMWAMALLPSEWGPRWLPIDPSSTIEGRPLRVGQRPPGPWQPEAPRQPRQRPSEPSWSKGRQPPRREDPEPPEAESPRRAPRPAKAPRSRPRSRGGAAAAPRGSRAAPPTPRALRRTHKREAPVAELIRVLRHAQRMAGQAPDSGAELREICEAILEDPHAAKQLLELLGKK